MTKSVCQEAMCNYPNCANDFLPFLLVILDGITAVIVPEVELTITYPIFIVV